MFIDHMRVVAGEVPYVKSPLVHSMFIKSDVGEHPTRCLESNRRVHVQRIEGTARGDEIRGNEPYDGVHLFARSGVRSVTTEKAQLSGTSYPFENIVCQPRICLRVLDTNKKVKSL